MSLYPRRLQNEPKLILINKTRSDRVTLPAGLTHLRLACLPTDPDTTSLLVTSCFAQNALITFQILSCGMVPVKVLHHRMLLQLSIDFG